MQKPSYIHRIICASGLILACALYSGCALDRVVHKARATNFHDESSDTTTVGVQSKGVYLRVAPDGNGFTAQSIEEANALLTEQGPLRRQILTIVPLSPEGKRMAPRLAQALTNAGAMNPQLGSYDVAGGVTSSAAQNLANQQQGWDIEIVSEALVVHAQDTTIAKPDLWTVSPYYAVGTLGKANAANRALMISDPRDILRPRSLDPAEGNVSAAAIERYQKGETRELVDINFSGDK
ncbi:MAG: CpaD family pilus assembly lipoprotein [Desulfovibrio sp.]|uniref:CpaD family pilus assembly lipoprotein n=1 Tax=Desulfovibrio sp. TaxID=885 RepID=UPI0039E63C4B